MATRRDKLREYLRVHPNLKKALIAGGVVAGGAVGARLAKGHKWLRRGAWGTAAAGLGGALAYGSEFAKRQGERAKALGRGAVTAGTLGKDLAMQNLRNIPTEAFVHEAIDIPFAAAEGALARNIAKRTQRIGEFAGSRLHEIQKAATMPVAARARRAQTSLFGLSDQADEARDNLIRTFSAFPKGLREKASQIQREKAVGEMGKLIKKYGSAALISPSQVNEILDRSGLPRSMDMRMWLMRATQERAVFGDRAF